jgi:hypothetical protein
VSSTLTEIIHRSQECVDVVSEESESVVARGAEETPDTSGVVIVVNRPAAMVSTWLRRAADRTASVLTTKHVVVIVDGDPETSARPVEIPPFMPVRPLPCAVVPHVLGFAWSTVVVTTTRTIEREVVERFRLVTPSARLHDQTLDAKDPGHPSGGQGFRDLSMPRGSGDREGTRDASPRRPSRSGV